MDGFLNDKRTRVGDKKRENCRLTTVMICSQLVISSADARTNCRAQIQPSNNLLLIIFAPEHRQIRDGGLSADRYGA